MLASSHQTTDQPSDRTQVWHLIHRLKEQAGFPVAGITVFKNGRFLRSNRALTELLGFTDENWLDPVSRALPAVALLREQFQAAQPTLTQGGFYKGECQLQRQDGTLFWAQLVGTAVDALDLAQGSIWLVADITERKRTHDRLVEATAVFQAVGQALMILDAANRIKTINPAFTRITGYAEEEVAGRDAVLLDARRDDDDFDHSVRVALARHGTWQGEMRLRRQNGEVFLAWVSLTAIKNGQDKVVETIAMFNDITERQAAEERIRYQASYDGLTGLPNRTLFLDRFAQDLAKAGREQHQLALLFIDVDRLKQVNDNLGHAAGDQLLCEAAKRFRDCVRESDTVARLGGDEFTIILPSIVNARDAAVVADHVKQRLSEPFFVDHRQVDLSASIGITIFPTNGETAEELLKNADTAMYRAKREGRAQYLFFDEQMNRHALQRATLERQLRHALHEDQFVLHYQPQLDLQHSEIIGAEVLLRWRHPQQGLMPPGRFLAVAEDTGLIDHIGEWVMRAACIQYKAWLANGVAPQRLSINVSRHQFKHGKLADLVRRYLALYDIPPGRLQLEITERALLENVTGAGHTFDALRQLGVCLSLDDFGTGHCSLNHLRGFPIDTVKIDRGFIDKVVTDRDDASVAAAIIAMANTARIAVIAEGVESRAQVDFLRDRQCHRFQGNYFSPPLAADGLTQLLCRPMAELFEPPFGESPGNGAASAGALIRPTMREHASWLATCADRLA